MDSETLRSAYDRADYEIVRTGRDGMYEILTATPAVLVFDDPPEGQAGDVQAHLEGHDYALIDAYCEDGPNGGIFVSAKVYDSETNEFVKIKADRSSIRIFSDDEDLSFETFRRFVEHVRDRLDIDLEVSDRD